MRRSATWILSFLAAIWLLVMLPLTRHAMIDDSLIHLRYASFLHDLHFITFDGVHPSFGTSSVLYVLLLAVLRGLTSSPMLPKCVSVFFYLAVVVLLFRQFLRMSAGSLGRWLTGALFLSLLSAMGIRWLNDGMETSFVLFLTFLLALALQHELHQPETPPLRWAGLLVLGFCISLLRIEMSLLVALACLALLVSRSRTMPETPLAKRLAQAAAPAIGTLLALSAIYLYFHALLPDTALAKKPEVVHFSLRPLFGIASVLASSVLLGVGIFLVWIVSAATVFFIWKSQPSPRHSLVVWTICNCGLLFLLLAVCKQGQSIQGVRYVLWLPFFSALWNIFQLQDVPLSSRKYLRPAIVVLLVLLLVALPVDLYYGIKTMFGRSNTYVSMRDAGLERFHGQDIIAGDVGFISYFTQANTCDIDGLVNGREIAKLTRSQRRQLCMSKHPTLIFATASQARDLNGENPIGDWTICHVFDFVNVNFPDRHYVMVHDPALCGSLGVIGPASQLLQTHNR